MYITFLFHKWGRCWCRWRCRWRVSV